MIHWDPRPEIVTVPIINWPMTWYGVLFAAGFAIGFPLFVSILTRFFGSDHKKMAIALTDRLVLYMVLGTVIGARLGHFLFYERPMSYLSDPLALFKIWTGGLASHGAIVGIVMALFLFRRRAPKELGLVKLLDFVCIPAALAGGLIRVGNFINQELLGTPTDLPWGVVFGHPFGYPRGYLELVPRHPVQLYEALFYFLVFLLLWRLSYQREYLYKEGKLIGLFFVLVFGFRFLAEYFKIEQSRLLSFSPLTMGQILSVPVVIVGMYLLVRKGRGKGR